MPIDIPRSEWGLKEPNEVVAHPVTSKGQAVSLVVLHHSVTNETPFVRTMQAIERAHISGDFFDYAYNASASNVSAHTAEGRGALVRGGATGNGVDSYSLSIVLIGSFHKPSDKRYHIVRDVAVDNVAHKIVSWIRAGYVSRNFKLDPHHDHYQTACCGDALSVRIPDIMTRVNQLLDGDSGETMIVIRMSQWDNHFNELEDYNLPDGVVEWYQEGLTTLGFYSGAIDGVKGPKTRAAWFAFEQSQGYPNANDRPGNSSTAAFRRRLAEIGDTVETITKVEVEVERIVEVKVEVPVVPAGLQASVDAALVSIKAAKRIVDTTIITGSA